MIILPVDPLSKPLMGVISADGRTTGDVPYKRDFSYSAVGTHTTKRTPGIANCYYHQLGNFKSEYTSVIKR
jgi:hypothetical protein